MSDNDIVKGLNKENVDSGQEQLNKIKNIKKNIQIDLIKQYLPGMFIKFMFMCLIDGFAEFYHYATSLSHSEKPDYDRLIKVLEKGKNKMPSYLGNPNKNNTLVDCEVILTNLSLCFCNSYSFATQSS